MGADIHIFPEIQWRDEVLWFSVGEFRPLRSYAAFRRIAGVRGWGWGFDPPTVAPRGAPEDSVKRFQQEEDLHTWTWMTLEEYEDAIRQADADVEQEGLDPGLGLHEEYWALVAWGRYLLDSGVDVRFVIAFDS